MNVIRPRVNEDYLYMIRKAYPDETATIITMEGLIEFALKIALAAASEGFVIVLPTNKQLPEEKSK